MANRLLVSASQQPNLAEVYIKILGMLDISRCKRYTRDADVDLDYQASRPILLDALACALMKTPSSGIYVKSDLQWVECISYVLASDQHVCYAELLAEVFFPILRRLSSTSQPLAKTVISIIARLPIPGPRIQVVSLVTCRFFSTICLLSQLIEVFGEESVFHAISAIVPLGLTALRDISRAELDLGKQSQAS